MLLMLFVVFDHSRLFFVGFRLFSIASSCCVLFGCFVSFQGGFSFLTLHLVVLRCFKSFSVACRCSMCFFRFRLFLVCFEFRKFFQCSLRLNVVQIDPGWFSFVPGCYIGYVRLLKCGSVFFWFLIEIVFGLLISF